ncbi:ribosomal protein L23, putative (apicoplast) [Plasmodium yoelii]|uniref:Ribosomal protein L23 n=2 Tax=Plasmodium yoelii TaxID=5861 RepID=A0AAE9WZP1_PLAYO|nr:ribosomal protein L23, putative [Plasmodium yoelii]WBY61415.1 ribosomal protein L23 [Plasmodium yoelii yoelii]BAL70681.1 large subunit ribosomal protein 23 [Plasmodium yoelii]CDU21048.1 ribosomal protein L23, putative [Plasmodium yoelii]VTZ82069.1 ribosomal protein L23, putative [Plasmodium yoelii]|eukprot:XP_022811201.1 ribosomal protein L23, putative (apicoplast) [Plasmodium yoelii]
MKEIILNFCLNNIFYKINFINSKFYIIYTNKYLTKLDIKYIIKNIFKFDISKNIKINNINKNNKNTLKIYFIKLK